MKGTLWYIHSGLIHSNTVMNSSYFNINEFSCIHLDLSRLSDFKILKNNEILMREDVLYFKTKDNYIEERGKFGFLNEGDTFLYIQ